MSRPDDIIGYPTTQEKKKQKKSNGLFTDYFRCLDWQSHGVRQAVVMVYIKFASFGRILIFTQTIA